GGGMALDAGPVAGRFRQDDVLELAFTLQPGKCYAAMAVSSGGIEDLVLELATSTLQVPNLPPVGLARNMPPGPDVTLGAPNCFKNPMPLPIPVLVRLKAAKGAGLAAAQVLSK